ncbi:hypothetical protein [Methylomicrobium agile]|uniref:hypothetical protein n=1 Tax=Methylomicrobium agile TaxID=39774 RepID=UPI0004DEE34E|nr:hypothetical protein [Methylomicrobium agile]
MTDVFIGVTVTSVGLNLVIIANAFEKLTPCSVPVVNAPFKRNFMLPVAGMLAFVFINPDGLNFG